MPTGWTRQLELLERNEGIGARRKEQGLGVELQEMFFKAKLFTLAINTTNALFAPEM